MPFAIIHTTSRVIRRLTTDDPPPIAADEKAFLVPDKFDVGGSLSGWWVLDIDNVSKRAALQAEIDAADVDEARIALKQLLKRTELLKAITNIESASSLPLLVRTFATRLREFLT